MATRLAHDRAIGRAHTGGENGAAHHGLPDGAFAGARGRCCVAWPMGRSFA